jgi:hypothetical protein
MLFSILEPQALVDAIAIRSNENNPDFVFRVSQWRRDYAIPVQCKTALGILEVVAIGHAAWRGTWPGDGRTLGVAA